MGVEYGMEGGRFLVSIDSKYRNQFLLLMSPLATVFRLDGAFYKGKLIVSDIF